MTKKIDLTNVPFARPNWQTAKFEDGQASPRVVRGSTEKFYEWFRSAEGRCNWPRRELSSFLCKFQWFGIV